MARIIVLDDDQSTLLDEKDVRREHLTDHHSALQLLDRLEWAIRDADRRMMPEGNRRASARRSRAVSAWRASAGSFRTRQT